MILGDGSKEFHHSRHQRVEQRLVGKIDQKGMAAHGSKEGDGAQQQIIPLRPQPGEKHARPEQEDPGQQGEVI